MTIQKKRNKVLFKSFIFLDLCPIDSFKLIKKLRLL